MSEAVGFDPSSGGRRSLDDNKCYTITEIALAADVSPLTARKWAKDAGYQFARGKGKCSYFTSEEADRIIGQHNPMWYVSRGRKPPAALQD